MKTRYGLGCLMVLSLLLGLSFLAPPGVLGRDVESPSSIEADLCGGHCLYETISFETGDLRINRIDIVFLLDVSGSMGAELEEVQSSAIEIMNDLQDLVPDTAFGVASFVDYPNYEGYGEPGDYPFRLEQDITTSSSSVQRALDQVSLLNGLDTPEAHSRALWEMLFLNWRADSKKIVIMFSDAYPHDYTFFDDDTGLDPGPDARGGTEDDLYFTEVVELLVEENITVIGVNSASDSADTNLFFDYVTEETNGQHFSLTSATDIPQAVTDLIAEEVNTVDRLTVRVAEEYEEWVTITPESYSDVGSFFSSAFEVEICPIAARAESGEYNFDLVIDGDGTVLETVSITINYDSRCTEGPEIYIADNDDDDGSVCTSGAFWLSPDIFTRWEDDGVYSHQEPVRGETNYIYARMHNIGDEAVDDAEVTFYWADPATGLWYPDSWDRIDSTRVDIGVGETVQTTGIAWDPPGASGESHFCLLVRIEADDDPILREGDVPCENNIAQRNVHVLDLTAETPTDEVSFEIVAPPEEHMGVIDIVVVIPDVPDGTEVWLVMPADLFARWEESGGTVTGGSIDGRRISVDPDAEEATIHDLPMEPEEEAEVELEIEAPVGEETAPFSITVVERVDGVDVGGNTYYYAPPAPLQPWEEALEFARANSTVLIGGICGLGLLLAIAIGGIVLIGALRRRGRRRAAAPAPPYQPPDQPAAGQPCPSCGANLVGAFKFCPHCGAEIPAPTPPPQPEAKETCAHCGAELRAGAKFCVKCGTPTQQQ
ncbi:MAG: zinc-ribbon domain-containing protein [Anaerolineae bacterium]|nr:zinc-ribbon domain-containing protein [Anaerolineae bacterium]